MSPRETLTESDLIARCRRAANAALRSKVWTPEDRDDCAMFIAADALKRLAVARDMTPVRHGTPADVLRHIDETLRRAPVIAAYGRMPDLQSIGYVQLKGRAKDWRLSEDARRDREALQSGRDNRGRRENDGSLQETPDHSADIARNIAAEDRMSQEAALDLASRCGAAVGRTGDVNVTAIFYQWTRGVDAETAASELGVPWQSFRKRTSRGAELLRASFSLADLCSLLVELDAEPMTASRDYWTQKPRNRRLCESKHVPLLAGETMLPVDHRIAAGHRGPSMAPDERTGTDGGEYPLRPATRDAADALCTLRHQTPAPKRAERNRARAHRDNSRDELRARARRSLAGAMRAGRPDRLDVGRTSGRPPEVYAPRSVRLGR